MFLKEQHLENSRAIIIAAIFSSFAKIVVLEY